MDKESFIINKFKNPFLGDDGAVIKKWVYSKDLFTQDTHFRLGWLSLREIAYKAMMVNISDAVAMNAVPKYALIGLGAPKDISAFEISELTSGFKQAASEFNLAIIGGDTIADSKIYISITIISKLNKRALFRNGAKIGDLVAFTGKLGGSLKALKMLLNGAKRANLSLNSRFIKPVLRDKFIYKTALNLNSAMDISDGLSADLAKLCAASKKGVRFSKILNKRELESGEEYEMLFSFSPKNRAKIERIAQKTRTKITIFAKITKGRYKSNVRKHHF